MAKKKKKKKGLQRQLVECKLAFVYSADTTIIVFIHTCSPWSGLTTMSQIMEQVYCNIVIERDIEKFSSKKKKNQEKKKKYHKSPFYLI